MSRPRLYISHLADLDWLIALEFGRVDDGQPPENWEGVCEGMGYLREGPGGRLLGFKILEFASFVDEAPKIEELWADEPHFDAPQLGLTDVPPGEIILAARAMFGDENSFNRDVFLSAIAAEQKEEALSLWRACLGCGDSMAHFAIGYTLYELGRYKQAYRHLRHYTEISPAGAWNWCWLGKAAEALGEITEARAAYARAIVLGDDETDAAELLEALHERLGAS